MSANESEVKTRKGAKPGRTRARPYARLITEEERARMVSTIEAIREHTAHPLYPSRKVVL